MRRFGRPGPKGARSVAPISAPLVAFATLATLAHAIEHVSAFRRRRGQPAPAQLLPLPGWQAPEGAEVLAYQFLGFRVELLKTLPAVPDQLPPLFGQALPGLE